ncbi:MAG: bis(5'-nucleosyl)-tetraphosphatase (symmetrical) YqeK, partial [Erysipelotrichaceae bacterium]
QIDTRFIEVKSNELFENASQKIREGAVHLTDSKIVQYMIDHELYIEEIASSLMSKKRFEHTKSVCELALSLASHHDVNIHQVYIAALFHDCAKEWSTKKSKDWLSFVYPEYLNNHQALWHQKCGSAYVKRVLMVRDKKILNAISHHIEGFNDDVSKIVYIADKCERTRAYDSSVFINMAMSDLNKAYIEVRNAQVKWLEKERVTIG